MPTSVVGTGANYFWRSLDAKAFRARPRRAMAEPSSLSVSRKRKRGDEGGGQVTLSVSSSSGSSAVGPVLGMSFRRLQKY